jgi:hypothetical protein
VSATRAVCMLGGCGETARADVAPGASRHVDEVLAPEVHCQQESHEDELHAEEASQRKQ